MDNQRMALQKGWRNEREGGMMESHYSISRPSGPLDDEAIILSFCHSIVWQFTRFVVTQSLVLHS